MFDKQMTIAGFDPELAAAIGADDCAGPTRTTAAAQRGGLRIALPR